MTEYQIPKHEIHLFLSKKNQYAIGIPVLNEGEKIRKQLEKMYALGLHQQADILIFDGDSSDGALEENFLKSVGVRALIVKKDLGKQGTQLRMGFDFVLKEGYKGIVTIDGNNKDSVESIPNFIEHLEKGVDFLQGSRYVSGGKGINTPLSRHLAVRFLHAPWISLLSGFAYTDTTSAFRGIAVEVLKDERLSLFRSIFSGYELLFYMSARIPRLGYQVKELPVTRAYPKTGKTPTKINFFGYFQIIFELIKLSFGFYLPK